MQSVTPETEESALSVRKTRPRPALDLASANHSGEEQSAPYTWASALLSALDAMGRLTPTVSIVQCMLRLTATAYACATQVGLVIVVATVTSSLDFVTRSVPEAVQAHYLTSAIHALRTPIRTPWASAHARPTTMATIAARPTTRALDAIHAASAVPELRTLTAFPALIMHLQHHTAHASATASGLATTAELAPSSEASVTRSVTDVPAPPRLSVYNVLLTHMSTTSDSVSVTTITTVMTVRHSSKTADIIQSAIPSV